MLLRKELDSSAVSIKEVKKAESGDNKIADFFTYDKERKIKAAKKRVYAAAKNLAW
jgi:hypothetical protein